MTPVPSTAQMTAAHPPGQMTAAGQDTGLPDAPARGAAGSFGALFATLSAGAGTGPDGRPLAPPAAPSPDSPDGADDLTPADAAALPADGAPLPAMSVPPGPAALLPLSAPARPANNPANHPADQPALAGLSGDTPAGLPQTASLPDALPGTLPDAMPDAMPATIAAAGPGADPMRGPMRGTPQPANLPGTLPAALATAGAPADRPGSGRAAGTGAPPDATAALPVPSRDGPAGSLAGTLAGTPSAAPVAAPPAADPAAARQETLAAGADALMPGLPAEGDLLVQSAAETRRPGTETALSGPHRSPADGPPGAERQVVAALLASASGRTEILLDPQDLGRVRLALEGDESGIVVTIHAERAETADLLRRNGDILREEFLAAGYGEMTFLFADRDDRDGPADTPDPPAGASHAITAQADGIPAHLTGPALPGTARLDLRL